MAILNVTPDSFFDGGRYDAPAAALARAKQAVIEGAHLLDVGAESTRPGSDPVTPAQQIERLRPVLAALRDYPLPVSVDTTSGEVAAEALRLGAVIVNDVSGGRDDPTLLDAAARAGAAVVLMHRRGTARTMQTDVSYDDLLGEVGGWLATSCGLAVEAGVPPEYQAVDAGIGFGKSARGCLELLAATAELGRRLHRPVLVGASRKSFLGKALGQEGEERLGGSVGVAAACAWLGAAILRVHDVALTRQAVDAAWAMRSAATGGPP
jgi:dihydropteroate synthase